MVRADQLYANYFDLEAAGVLPEWAGTSELFRILYLAHRIP